MNPGTLPPVSTPERSVPAGRRGGAAAGAGAGPRRPLPDRHRRSSTRWTAALGPVASGPATQPWLDRDPELTQPGPRPTPQPGEGALPEPALPRPPRPPARGADAGRAARAGRRRGSRVRRPARAARRPSAPSPTTTARSRSPSRRLGPRRRDRRGGSRPTATAAFAALSVGTSKDWARAESDGEGVFVALLPGTELPEQLPQHPECETAGRVIRDTQAGNESTTIVYSDCPGGGVVVERVVLVVEQHAAVGAGPQRRPGDGQPGPRRRARPTGSRTLGTRALRLPSVAGGASSAIVAAVRLSRSRSPSWSTRRPVAATSA